MDWLRRVLGTSPPPVTTPDEAAPEAVERHAPGVAAVLEGVGDDRSHAVLDLGPATDTSLHVYSRFASRIRFVDLLRTATSEGGCAAALRAVPPQPELPYDLVFVWDVLERLFPEDRVRLVRRLDELSADDVRLHVLTEASEDATTRPLRFSLLDVDRIRCEPAGPARPARRQLLPAEVARLLAPFQVVRAFTLKAGFREYVAVRSDR